MIQEGITPDLLNKRFNIHLTKHLGIHYTEVGKDYICAEMPVDDRTQQPFGLLHGGASVVLAESLCSLGANLCVDQSKYTCVGLEINANHIRGVKEGKVIGRAQLLHLGKKTQVWETKISNEEGLLVCASRMTIAVLEKK